MRPVAPDDLPITFPVDVRMDAVTFQARAAGWAQVSEELGRVGLGMAAAVAYVAGLPLAMGQLAGFVLHMALRAVQVARP